MRVKLPAAGAVVLHGLEGLSQRLMLAAGASSSAVLVPTGKFRMSKAEIPILLVSERRWIGTSDREKGIAGIVEPIPLQLSLD